MVVAEFFGFVAAVLGVTQAWPQARRVRSLGHSDGVSLAMWAIMLTSTGAWLGCGIQLGSPSLIISCAVSGVMNLNVIVAVTGRPRIVVPRFALLYLTAMTAVLVLPTWISGPMLFLGNLSRVPQVVRSWRSRRDGVRESAVSVGWMVTGLVCLLSWEVYSILFRSVTLIASTTLALVLALAVAWLELGGRRTPARVPS